MKEKIISILFLVTITSFGIIGFILPDKEISYTERRTLTKFPTFSINAVWEGTYFEDLNNYLVEHFPIREFFRSIKGYVSKTVFQKKEENNVFTEENGIYELNFNLNEKSVNHFIELIQEIEQKYFQKNSVFYGIIPDKNYYLEKDIPKLDYQKLEDTLKLKLSNMTYISLFDSLDLDDYYRTDIHWKQENLQNVKATILKELKQDETLMPEEKKTYPEFYGALYGRIAHNIKPDKLVYLTNPIIENATVYNYEKQQTVHVYEETNLSNVDSYDIFLGGAKSLLFVKNEQSKTKKRLILFRDSFGSSLAPLLIENYSEIILIDLRYISSKYLDSIPELNLINSNQDVLFLYSASIINNSFTLK